MNKLYLIGSGLFIVATAWCAKAPQNAELMGYLAFCALLGLLGQMERQWWYMPLFGLLIGAGLMYHNGLEMGQITISFGFLSLAIIWNLLLCVHWIKPILKK